MSGPRLSLVFLLALAACGGDAAQRCTGSDDPEALQGSYCEGAEIAWDTVRLGWFPRGAILRIRYGVAEADRISPRFEIQVFGEQVRLEPGVRVPLAEAGNVRRWPEGGRDPQDLHDRLEPSSGLELDVFEPEVGRRAEGRFDLLLDNGRTLRGRFAGVLEDLSPPD